jgi:hypothetical protein
MPLSCEGKLPPRCEGALLLLLSCEGCEGIDKLGNLTGTLSQVDKVGSEAEADERDENGGAEGEASDGGRWRECGHDQQDELEEE